jgi:hypothetical protein
LPAARTEAGNYGTNKHRDLGYPEQDVSDLGILMVGMLDEVPDGYGGVGQPRTEDERVPPSLEGWEIDPAGARVGDDQRRENAQPKKPVGLELLAYALELIVLEVPAEIQGAAQQLHRHRGPQKPEAAFRCAHHPLILRLRAATRSTIPTSIAQGVGFELCVAPRSLNHRAVAADECCGQLNRDPQTASLGGVDRQVSPVRLHHRVRDG